MTDLGGGIGPPGTRKGKLTLAREFVLFAPSVLVPSFVGFISLVILTRLVEPAPYGRYALALGVATTVSAIGGDWLVPMTIHFRPRYDEADAHPFITSVAKLGAGIAAAAGLVSAALLVPPLGWAWAAAGTALTAAMMLSKTISGILRANLLTKRFSMAAAGAALFGLATGITTFLITDATAALIWGMAAGTLIVMLVAGWSSVAVPLVERAAARIPWKPLLNFGIPIAVAGIGGQALLLADRYIIAAVRGDVEVGLYTPAYSMANRVLALIFAPAFGALYPIMARLWSQGDTEEGLDLIEIVHRAFVVVGGYAILMFVFFHRQLADLVLGAEFREASVVMAIVAPASFLWFVGILFHQVFEQSERTREITLMVAAAAAFNVVLNLVFVPRFGYIAAAWSTLASYVSYAMIAYAWSSSKQGMQSRIPWSSYIRICGFAAAIATWLLLVDEGPSLWIAVAVTFPLFVAVLVLTGEPLVGQWRKLLELRKERGADPPAPPSEPR